MSTFFGNCQSDGSLNASSPDLFDGGDNGYTFGKVYACPGSGPQNVSSMGAYVKGTGDFRVAIYTSDGATKKAEMTAKASISAAGEAWVSTSSITQYSTLTGGTNYLIAVAFKGSIQPGYDSGGADIYNASGGDGYCDSGFPSSLTLASSIGSDYLMRAGVDTATTTPATPTSLTAVASSTTQIDLTWVDPNSGAAEETSILIKYGTDNVTFASTTTASADATTKSITGLTEGTQYFFQIAATNAAGTSAYTESAPAYTLPTAPTLNSVSITGTNALSLDYDRNSTHNTGVEIQYTTNADTTFASAIPITYAQGNSPPPVAADAFVTGDTYRFRMRNTVNGGTVVSAWSSVVTTVATAPAAPANLAFDDSFTTTSARITWDQYDPSPVGGSSIEGQWSLANTFTSPTTFTGADTDIAATVTGLPSGTLIYFCIRAITTDGTSDWSNTTSGTTDAAPGGGGGIGNQSKMGMAIGIGIGI